MLQMFCLELSHVRNVQGLREPQAGRWRDPGGFRNALLAWSGKSLEQTALDMSHVRNVQEVRGLGGCMHPMARQSLLGAGCGPGLACPQRSRAARASCLAAWSPCTSNPQVPNLFISPNPCCAVPGPGQRPSRRPAAGETVRHHKACDGVMPPSSNVNLQLLQRVHLGDHAQTNFHIVALIVGIRQGHALSHQGHCPLCCWPSILRLLECPH